MQQITWATHAEVRDLLDLEDVIVWVDVSKANICWQKDDFYIPEGAPEHRGKYERFGLWLCSASCKVEMAHVSIGRGGSISFTNGRHRFAWMRDHGAKALPFTIWRGQATRLAKLAGTNLRSCQLGQA